MTFRSDKLSTVSVAIVDCPICGREDVVASGRPEDSVECASCHSIFNMGEYSEEYCVIKVLIVDGMVKASIS